MADLPTMHLLPLIVLYAETHFRFFPLFPSLLFKKVPEILFDCPRRLEPGQDLPLLLILHDGKKYPVTIDDISVTVSGGGFSPKCLHFEEINRYEKQHPFSENLQVFVFPVPRDQLAQGECFINAKINVTDKKRKQHIILNDNLTTSSKLPFTCNVSSEQYPGAAYATYGDFHVHSSYSESHVEFGPPVEAISRLANAAGTHVVALTDHSYDLACSVTDYLTQDPSGERWKLFCKECNSTGGPTVILRGEEVSCLNSSSQVVHVCGVNHTEYIPGTLDGARRNTHYKTQLTIPEVVRMIHDQGGLAYAAHPGSKKSLMQQLFLRRGVWEPDDCIRELDAFQAYNSGFNRTWERALSLWKIMLAKGWRIPLLAGNDAHGDFNRYRAIGIPFISILELFDRQFGTGRTGIYGRVTTVPDTIAAIREGATFITTGPYLSINTSVSPETYAVHSKGVPFSQDLYLHSVSTLEFGRLQKLFLHGFDTSTGAERIIFSKIWQKPEYDSTDVVNCAHLINISYIRSEVHSISEKGTVCKAFTSGCFNTERNTPL